MFIIPSCEYVKNSNKICLLVYVLTKLRSLSAFYVVKVVAVFGKVFGVGGVEGESIAASLDLSYTVVALPVFVAGNVVRVEAKIVRAFEGLLGHRCGRNLQLVI